MSSKTFLLIILLIAVVLYLLATRVNIGRHLTQSQPSTGLTGQVTETSGDCMPGLGDKNNCITTVVSTRIIIRELTGKEPPVNGINYPRRYHDNTTKVVATVVSGPDGKYTVDVPPGTYSVFVEDRGKEYCDIEAGGNLCPVEVTNGYVEHNIEITARAAY